MATALFASNTHDLTRSTHKNRTFSSLFAIGSVSLLSVCPSFLINKLNFGLTWVFRLFLFVPADIDTSTKNNNNNNNNNKRHGKTQWPWHFHLITDRTNGDRLRAWCCWLVFPKKGGQSAMTLWLSFWRNKTIEISAVASHLNLEGGIDVALCESACKYFYLWQCSLMGTWFLP